MTLWLCCLLCLLVGFLAGIALDDALDLIRSSRKARAMTVNNPHIPTGRTVMWAVLIFAVGVQVLVGGALIKSRFELQNAERDRAEYESCSNRWQQDFATAYKARVKSSTEASNALEVVIRAVGAQDPDRFRAAVAEYLRLRDTQISEQQKNPYPPLPDELCGDKP